MNNIKTINSKVIDDNAREDVKVHDLAFEVNGFTGSVRVYIDEEGAIEYDIPSCLSVIEDDGDRFFHEDALFDLIADHLNVD